MSSPRGNPLEVSPAETSGASSSAPVATSAPPETATTTTPAAPVAPAPAPATPAAAAAAASASTPAHVLPPEPTNSPSQEAQQSEILPASHWAQAPPIDDDFDDNNDDDSAFGDNASSTASLTASIFEYRTVLGRTFHSERGNAQSWNPNDAKHDESMDILHHVSTLMQDGKLYLAPISRNVQKVLDVGCGTGIWAIDFADEFPGTEVIGLDISAQQPQWIPPNLKFELDDITRPWTYDPDTFDYIHMRWLVGAIPDWTALYKEIFFTLKPGGYFENKESSAVITSDDGTVAEGSALDQWGKMFGEAGRKSGRTFRVVEDEIQRKAMQEAGFVDIVEHNFKVPLGPWPADEKQREIGQYAQLALEQDIEGFITYLWSTDMGWTREEIQVYAAHLRRELHSRRCHALYPQRVVIGRKPYRGEVS